MALCPECEAVLDLDLDEVEEGQLVSCPECGVELEVVNTNPLEFDLAEEEDLDMEEEEDLDFDEEEDEDFDEEEDEDEEDYDE